jgi:hypothetical protein
LIGDTALVHALPFVDPFMIDIKDAAKVHVKAMESNIKTNKQKRLICNGDQFEWIDALMLLKEQRPELKNRIVSDLDLIDRLNQLRAPARLSTKLSEAVLGIKKGDYIDWKTCILGAIDMFVAWEAC